MAQSHGDGRLCRGVGRFRPCGVVSFINTRKLESWYSVLPFQAVMACLAQVEPVGQGWCKEATDLFRRLTTSSQYLTAKAKSIQASADGQATPGHGHSAAGEGLGKEGGG